MINRNQAVGKYQILLANAVVWTCILTAFLGFYSGCSPDSELEDLSGLRGTVWEMELMIAGATNYAGSPGNFNLEIEEAFVSGRSDCNLWSSGFTSGKNSLKLIKFVSTKIACPPTSIEGPYFDVLLKVSSFEYANQMLTFRAGPTDLIVYRSIES